jgi:hypothetical protein
MATAPLGPPQPSHAHFTPNAAGPQAKNAAQIVDGINAISMNDVRTISPERARPEQGRGLLVIHRPFLNRLDWAAHAYSSR